MKNIKNNALQSLSNIVKFISPTQEWYEITSKFFWTFSKKSCWQKQRDVLKYLGCQQRQHKGPWKLNNIGKNSKLEKESKRFFWEVWGARPHDNKKESRVIQRNAKRLREWVNTDIKRYLIKIGFNEEFDPGSGRTLAARLTHASRTELRGACFSWLSGERVSNAWVTCLRVGDNSWKRLLIPHKTTGSHGPEVKGFIRFEMDSRPIS